MPCLLRSGVAPRQCPAPPEKALPDVAWSLFSDRVERRAKEIPRYDLSASAGLSVIQPGQAAHEPHAHDGEEIMFVLEGLAEIRIGAETERAGPNTAVFCPPHVFHGIRNAGDTPIRYMIIRTP